MVEKIELEKCNFRNITDAVTLTLNLVIWHTVVHHSSTSIYIPNFIEIGQTFCGRTYGRTWTYLLTEGHSPSNVIRSTLRSRPNNNNVYADVITTIAIKAIARILVVNLMNTHSVLGGCWPSHLTRPVSPPVGCYCPHQTPQFVVITQPKSWHFSIPSRAENSADLGTAVTVYSRCPVVSVVLNITACGEIKSWYLSHCSYAYHHQTKDTCKFICNISGGWPRHYMLAVYGSDK